MQFTGIKQARRPTLEQTLRIPLAITLIFQVVLLISVGPVFLRPELDERTQPFVFVEAQKLTTSDHISSYRSSRDSTNHLAIVYPRYGLTQATIFSSNLALQTEFATRDRGEAWGVISGDFEGDGASEWLLSIPLRPDLNDNEFTDRDNAVCLIYWNPERSIEQEIDRIQLSRNQHPEILRIQPWRGRISALGNPHGNTVETPGDYFALGVAIFDPPYYVREIHLFRKGNPPRKTASIPCAVFPRNGVWSTLADGQRVLTVGGTVLGNGVRTPVVLQNESTGGTVADTLDDSQGTVMQVTESGKVRWVRKLSKSGGQVYVYPRTGDDDELIAVFSRDSFNYGTDELDILILNASTGAVISSSTFPGSYQHLVGEAARELGLAGIIRTDTHVMRWLNLTGEAGPVMQIRGLKRAGELSALKLTGDIRVVAIPRATGEGTLLITPNGRCVGAAPNDFEANVVRIHVKDEDVDVVPLVSESYASNRLVYYVHNPSDFWWIWRYRWWIVLLLGPPFITFAVTSTQRYIVERRATVKAIQAYNVQLRHLTRRLHESQEQERTQLSREIHDRVGQSLAVIRWGLSEISKNGRRGKRKVEDLIVQVDEALAEIRRISQELRPSLLDDLGLVPALEWYLKMVTERTGLGIKMRSTGKLGILQPELATALYRIVQEGISNVLKHAKASQVQVTFYSDHDNLRLVIEDNGKGLTFRSEPSRTPLGLMGMRERLMPFNGEVTLESGRREGVCLTATVPMRKE
ncbi:MAG: sensor histidine kinase [bacterium]